MQAKLESVATIQVGYQAKASIIENVAGSHKLIQGKDIDASNQLSVESLLRFFPERRPELYSVAKDDILFMARGTRNFAFYVDRLLPDTLVSSSFYIIRLNTDRIIPGYLAWWLNQRMAQDYFRTVSSGGTIAFVSKSSLGEVLIEAPSPVVQKQIVRIMALWTRERSIRERLAEQRESLIRSMTLQAIEGKE